MGAAAKHGLALVLPDTSPRGAGIEGEDDSYDFGSGAGFYVDATVDKWAKNYRMYTYITEELPKAINANFPVDPSRVGITGRSMGGHGALTIALKTQDRLSQFQLSLQFATLRSAHGVTRLSKVTLEASMLAKHTMPRRSCSLRGPSRVTLTF